MGPLLGNRLSVGGSESRTNAETVVALPGVGQNESRCRQEASVIQTRRLQRRFADGLIAEEIEDLREPWMSHSDRILQDDRLLATIQQTLSRRCTKSKRRGRPATTAEVVLRMLLLKHIYNWSYQDLTREVRANLIYRDFTGIGAGKVPDDKTRGRLGRQLGPQVIENLRRRKIRS
jgi:IS5 family transposase